MKIWELLTSEFIGKQITNDSNQIVLSIASDENSDIVLVDGKGGRVAISKLLIEENWELIKREGWERNTIDGEYSYIDECGLIKVGKETSTITDELRFINVNYFIDSEIAKTVKDFEFINRSLLRFRETHKVEDIDSKKKFFISFNERRGDFEIVSTDIHTEKAIGVVYFETEELAQSALESLFKEIKEFYSK